MQELIATIKEALRNISDRIHKLEVQEYNGALGYYRLIDGSRALTTSLVDIANFSFRQPNTLPAGLYKVTITVTISTGTSNLDNGFAAFVLLWVGGTLQPGSLSASLYYGPGGERLAGVYTQQWIVSPWDYRQTVLSLPIGPPLSQTLRGYWRLGDRTSSLVAIDSSANGRNGTYNGFPSWEETGLIIPDLNNVHDYSMLFHSNTSDYISATSSGTTGNQSISLWVKIPDPDAVSVSIPFSIGNGATPRLSLRVGGTFTDANNPARSIALLSNAAEASSIADTFTTADDGDQVVHIAATYDSVANTVVIYKNGVALSMASQNIAGSIGANTVINIGRKVDGTGYVDGHIDEVSYVSGVLTADQISALYAAGVSPTNYDNMEMTVNAFKSGGTGDSTIGSGSMIVERIFAT